MTTWPQCTVTSICMQVHSEWVTFPTFCTLIWQRKPCLYNRVYIFKYYEFTLKFWNVVYLINVVFLRKLYNNSLLTIYVLLVQGASQRSCWIERGFFQTPIQTSFTIEPTQKSRKKYPPVNLKDTWYFSRDFRVGSKWKIPASVHDDWFFYRC